MGHVPHNIGDWEGHTQQVIDIQKQVGAPRSHPSCRDKLIMQGNRAPRPGGGKRASSTGVHDALTLHQYIMKEGMYM